MLIEQIDILANIATEFSSFAKMPQPKLDYYSVNDLIQNSVQLFASSEEQTIKLVNTGNKQLKARIDKDQFCRVINNLIKNAQQSIPANRLPEIIISLFNKEDKWIQIDIKDNGLGIPDELKSKIFYPNFSSKSDGMGLGLAMTKNIIESFNGTINFVTVVNEGTTFTVLLPIEK